MPYPKKQAKNDCETFEAKSNGEKVIKINRPKIYKKNKNRNFSTFSQSNRDLDTDDEIFVSEEEEEEEYEKESECDKIERFYYTDDIKNECENLIKYLETSTDSDELKIKEFMIATICCKETMINPINLSTEDSKLAMSTAAKHGFSNVVKFLISKGVEKEHFTKDHHTPLSLAVAGNFF